MDGFIQVWNDEVSTSIWIFDLSIDVQRRFFFPFSTNILHGCGTFSMAKITGEYSGQRSVDTQGKFNAENEFSYSNDLLDIFSTHFYAQITSFNSMFGKKKMPLRILESELNGVICVCALLQEGIALFAQLKTEYDFCKVIQAKMEQKFELNPTAIV